MSASVNEFKKILGNAKTIIMAIYVDDGIVTGEDKAQVESVIEHLQKEFEIEQMPVGCFLGLEIDQRADGSIFMQKQKKN